MQLESNSILKEIQSNVSKQFQAKSSVLSFDEYLAKVQKSPRLHLRNAASYFLDTISHFGSYKKDTPFGTFQRLSVFDSPFETDQFHVFGQESAQEALLQLIEHFASTGKIDKLILLHGPNGSAKTTLVNALIKAAERYSHTDDGILYRFNWIFPNKSISKSLGFSGRSAEEGSSYAYLPADAVEAKIHCENKDHPLLLLPIEERNKLFHILKETTDLAKDYTIPDILLHGELSAKNRKIFDALLHVYHGDLSQVFRHIQVERFYLSRRYRTGFVSVEPQMSVDAHVRQVTVDQSFGALPIPLRHLSLFEVGGALVDANRGLVEYSDLLKRPLESWKYLLVATEQGQTSLEFLNLFFDMLMVASSNELHLHGFREYPDWPSFKARFELIPLPYLLRVSDEVRIYESQIPKALGNKHIAPHSLYIAALWAVLTRLEPPKGDACSESVRSNVCSLTPLEKAMLYDTGNIPERFSQKENKELKSYLRHLCHEHSDSPSYEGQLGASPREIRILLLNASNHRKFDHLSPIAVLEEIRDLIKQKSSYEFLRREPQNGYRDASHLLDVVKDHYNHLIEEEIRSCALLVESDSHRQLMERYIHHVSAWTKKERLHNPVTGKMVDPDKDLMDSIEEVLRVPGETQEDFRHALIGQIGAFKLEYPDSPLQYEILFGAYLKRLKEDYYAKQKKALDGILKNYLLFTSKESLSADIKKQCEAFHKNLIQKGYTESSAKQAVAYLLANGNTY